MASRAGKEQPKDQPKQPGQPGWKNLDDDSMAEADQLAEGGRFKRPKEFVEWVGFKKDQLPEVMAAKNSRALDKILRGIVEAKFDKDRLPANWEPKLLADRWRIEIVDLDAEPGPVGMED